MCGVRICKWLTLAAVAAYASNWQEQSSQPKEPVRRAVIVGIDRYRSSAALPPIPVRSDRLEPKNRKAGRTWSDLEGAVNDAESIKALLIGRFGFAAGQIVIIENEKATADAILGAIRSQLIDEAAPDDISFFFYAGHGSLIRNTRTQELSGFDQTIVPADAPRGTPDIRDKELARLFRIGVEKGVKLTAVFDSCHSGSITRGRWSRASRIRSLEPDSGYVEDADVDGSGRPLPDPAALGMLALSATQDTDTATEIDTDSGPHGLFTWAFLKVFQTAPPNEQAESVFQRVRALMQSEGRLQEPVFAGNGRSSLSLLGLKSDGNNALTAAVERVWDNRVRLQAGAGIGLNDGCELRKVVDGKASGPLVRVEKVLGLSSSEAVLIGPVVEIHEGDLFQVVRWTAPESAALRVFVPQTRATGTQLARFAADLLAQLGRGRWIEDPTVEIPTHVMSWSGRSWILEQNPAAGAPLNFGPNPNAAAVARGLPVNARLLLLLPAPQSLATDLRLGAGSTNEAITVEKSPTQAHYLLCGRYAGGRLEYAWALPNALATDLQKLSNRRAGGNQPAMAMPIRTDWVTTARELTDSALTLGRIHGWLQLDAPADSSRFPYHLAVRDEKGDGALITSGVVSEGQSLGLVLVADPEVLRASVQSGSLTRRWVYVFCIDQHGTSKVLFPADQRGNVENRFPVKSAGQDAPATIRLGGGFDIGEPFGIDTYFLLATEEPLPSPEVLGFDGVVTRGETRRGADPLGRLIARMFEGKRGASPAVPMNWSIERLTLRSVRHGELNGAAIH